MATNILPSQITPPKLHLTKPFTHHRRRPPLPIPPIASTGSRANGTLDDDDNLLQPSGSPPTTKPPSDRLELRFRRGAKGRQRRLDQETVERLQREPEPSDELQKRKVIVAPPKKWEEMTMGEKALELYVGEKGLLFWLNKFAYASIFIVIGGWILFRFVGPALNLYQLDTPPLSPANMLKVP